MARLLDDLLDVSRITRGTLEIRRSLVTVDSLVDAAAEIGAAATRHAPPHFTIHLPAETLWLDADPLRLAQVIGNLLTMPPSLRPGRPRRLYASGRRQ